ncbi:DNA polymerase III subunit alpha [Nibricoccus sp. IMCC34717]|uniref:DNA polymerase III subunit alpha n=1 Tax=Nibricoccus sp. IMCC34717 TaxID=3034021 RepID=UPI00385056A0
MDYVELHARSAFSFLRAGSSPEALTAACAKAGLRGFALCDRDGFQGSVRHYITGRELGVHAWVGCELTLADESVVPVLAGSLAAYQQTCRALTTTHLRAEKGEARLTWDELARLAAEAPDLIALTGDEEGPLRRTWTFEGPVAADLAGRRLLACFGHDRLYVEIQRHRQPEEEPLNAFLVAWARTHHLPLLATNGVCYAEPADAAAHDVLCCLRLHCTLDQAGRRLAKNRERHLKSAVAMRALFADLPEAVDNTVRLAARLPFDLSKLGYRFPDYAVPAGESQDSFLHKVATFGAQQRYGSVVGRVRSQIERELKLIAKLGFSGYFLIVWDICTFARERGILVQGRGSAANSVVCYALGITAVDPIASDLLFERFLSEGRSDWPDIDLDLPSGDCREEVIQEVYRRYGRRGAAMTANVICFKGRSTFREVGKVFGFADDVLDRFSSLFHGGDYPHTLKLQEQVALAGICADHPRLPALLDTCSRVFRLPRHLGQHSGGIVISSGGLDACVPLENARMPGRTILQWDKSDCEDLGIIKIDFLGLGMMAVLQDALSLCAERGHPVDLARIPKDDPATFEMIQKADTIGVFQIESRAQMATLPRMKPVTFYDLAVEVAIIRPGPIHGDAVHPYLARRAGEQPVSYPDERARPILERTLGVVLFQEQILRLAMELGGFTAAEADELRRAIGFTRSKERLERMQHRLTAALRANDVSEAATESIIRSLASFSLYGFPESHAISFALIAYASAWLKVHRAAEFYAALLNNQPMGFYSPASLIQDARRRGLRFLPVCVIESGAACSVVDDACVRLGLRGITGLTTACIQKLVTERRNRPFASLSDFLARVRPSRQARQLLAEAGAFQALASHRRDALWQVEAVHPDDDLFQWGQAASQTPAATASAAAAAPADASLLKPMTLTERMNADYRTQGLTVGRHPMALVRHRHPHLIPAGELARVPTGAQVEIGGSVITRQRPGTAKGICFITLEDETGLANAIVYPDLFEARRLVINLEAALRITGTVQNDHGVIHILAHDLRALGDAEVPVGSSHDYH